MSPNSRLKSRVCGDYTSKGIKTVTSKKLRFFSKYAISEYIPEIKTEETTALEYYDNTKFIAMPENNYKDKFDYSYNKEDCLNFIKRSIKIKPSIAIKFTLFYTVFFFIFLVFITGFISMIIFNGKLPLRREYFLLSNLGLAFISSAVSIINSTKKSIKTAKLNASLHHPDTASIYIYEDSVVFYDANRKLTCKPENITECKLYDDIMVLKVFQINTCITVTKDFQKLITWLDNYNINIEKITA